MALTPAQKYRQEKLAKKAAAQDVGGSPHGALQGSDYELMLANLAEHRRTLSKIKAEEGKAAHKATALQDFDGWVDGVLAEGQGQPDPLFVEMMVWNMDAGNYERVLEMAAYAIQHKLEMPDQFKRAIPEFLMDTFAIEYYKGALGDKAESLMAKVIELTKDIDSHDQPRAKLLKAHAFALVGCRPDSVDFKDHVLDAEKGKTALEELSRAIELDEKVGVKKDMERLDAALKALERSSETSSGETASPSATRTLAAQAEEQVGGNSQTLQSDEA